MLSGALLAEQHFNGIKPAGHIQPLVVWVPRGLRNALVARAPLTLPPALFTLQKHLELTWSFGRWASFVFCFFFISTWITFVSLTWSPEAQDEMESEKYLPELMAEKDTLDPSFQHSLRLLDQGKWPCLNTEVNTLAVWKPRESVTQCSGFNARFWAAGYMTPPARLLQVKNMRFVVLLTVSCLVTLKERGPFSIVAVLPSCYAAKAL